MKTVEQFMEKDQQTVQSVQEILILCKEYVM
jgi:hypothetical protein